MLDVDGDTTDVLDHFDFIKDATRWVKDCGLSKAYWDRRAERDGYAEDNVHTIQLWVDGECRNDWFPDFTKPPKVKPWAFHVTDRVKLIEQQESSRELTHGVVVFHKGNHNPRKPRVRWASGWGTTVSSARLRLMTPAEVVAAGPVATIPEDHVYRT